MSTENPYEFIKDLGIEKYLLISVPFLYFISAILYPEVLRFLVFYSGKMKSGLNSGKTIERGYPAIQGYEILWIIRSQSFYGCF